MMLELSGVESGYGSSQVLFGVDLAIRAGEAVSLLGRNGMGKTTTVRTIMGLTPPRAGSIRWNGREMAGQPSYRIARLGIGLVPEGRQIFPNLTVRENLVAPARRGNWTLARVHDLFPRLAERGENLGNQLSGGEQQMLAIGRALMTNPDLLILDEATEGLAPIIRADIWQAIRALREAGHSMLIIDSSLDTLLEVCDRHYIIEKGRIVWSGNTAELRARPDLAETYLAI